MWNFNGFPSSGLQVSTVGCLIRSLTLSLRAFGEEKYLINFKQDTTHPFKYHHTDDDHVSFTNDQIKW